LIGCSVPTVPLAPLPAPAALDPDQARALLKALADPIRLQVIEALGGGERCVCELTEELDLAQSKLSFHLKVLKEAGLLADRQCGRWVYYQLRPEALERLRGWLAELAAGCTAPATVCG
jgi:ArsR family transcriptional regulator